MINYESPLYIDIVLYTIYALLLAATVLTVWSAVRSLRLQGREGGPWPSAGSRPAHSR